MLTKLPRLLREPTLHFFAIAGVLLSGQHLVAGDARTIEVTSAQKVDLLRRYRDQLNRPPSRAESEAFLAAWKAEEALYREALREGIDRDDATVRAVLIGKMRERALLQRRLPEPTEADLREYFERHRNDFEAPLVYEYEYVVFPKSDPNARAERGKYGQKLSAGETPASLGLRSMAANVNRARIEQEFGAEVAEKLIRLPPLRWHELETIDRLLLVRPIRIHGGLPEPPILRERLAAAWKGEKQRQAVADATRAIVERYRFDESSE
jgi:hypothetical protein